MSKISGIQACVFDAYGTMFDVHSAVNKVSDALGDKAAAVSILWRDKQLQYTWLRSLMQDFEPFSKVTSDALDFALEAHGVEVDGLHEKLMDAYFRLDAYDDVAPTLDALRAKGLKTAILSNGSPDMLGAAVANAALGDKLDAVLTVDIVGVNKPDPRVYQMPLDEFGIQASEVCFISNNAWDCHGGAHFGYQVARLNRNQVAEEKLSGRPRITLNGLQGLADLIDG